MAEGRKENQSMIRCVWGFLLITICAFLSLSLYSYDWQDISLLMAPPNRPPANLIGPVGAWMSFFLFIFFGIATYLAPLWCLVFGLLLIFQKDVLQKFIWCLVLTFMVSCLVELRGDWWVKSVDRLNIPFAGGFMSYALTNGLLVNWLSPVGAGILIWAAFFTSLILFVGPSSLTRFYGMAAAAYTAAVGRIKTRLEEGRDRRDQIEKEESVIERRRRALEKSLRRRDLLTARPEEPAPSLVTVEKKEPRPERVEEEKETEPVSLPRKLARRLTDVLEKKEEKAPPVRQQPPPSFADYRFPTVDLLEKPDPAGSRGIKTDTATASRVLVETLLDFGIETQVNNIEVGPVVTRYELLPAPGIKVERISSLSNNMALALKSSSIRVQAPVPGKGVVGIEVPNASFTKVYLREVLDGNVWKSGKACLPLALGKDVAGSDIVADLATMPHVLIAGATGSGKTVCMNSILAGLLMTRRPDELKLLLVDPKIVEFSAFNELPHLAAPVITNPRKVAIGLRWAINEMERRYKLFAKVGVRNIESYNSRPVATQAELFSDKSRTEDRKDEIPPTVPYIVIVIDELADLMLVDQAEIENCIARLAQLSRAVGIHMILATQRPSVNVITGTIKANFPSRIAFQVAQKVDSRTILDTIGADKLLGRGDMLFLPPGSSRLIRAQGCWTSDKDIQNIVEFIKKQAKPDYVIEVQGQLEKAGSAPGALDEGEDDDLLNQAIDIIRETQRASTSSLQRRLRIGYTRAARLMDILQERGIVGPPKGSDPREILVDLEGQIPNNAPPEEKSE